MKYTNRVVALVAVLLLFNCHSAKAQLDSCNIFLKGAHIEVGVNTNGAYGSSVAAPKGFHPKGGAPIFNTCYPGKCVTFGTNVGFVADPDKDGWTVGTPPYFGDYFLPGSPQEGWSVQVESYRINAWNGNDYCPGGSPFTYTGTKMINLGYGNALYDSSNTKRNGIWEGVFDSLRIMQNTVMDTNTVYFTVYMTLANLSHTTKHNVYYLRTVDPDNDEPEPGGGFTTKNKIEYQLPNPQNRTMVSATGLSSPSAFLGLGTLDCRAKCFIIHGSLTPNWGSLDTMYGTGNFLDTIHYQYHDSETSDEGIGLVFKLGDIPAGDSITFAYAYVLRKGDLDSAFESTRPKWKGSTDSNEHRSGDTILVCNNSVVTVNVVNGTGFTWHWDSPTGNRLSDTVGLINHVWVDTGVTIVRAIGATPACASDTEYIYLKTFTPPPPILSNNGPLCVGDTLQLSATRVSDSTTSFVWHGPNGFSTGAINAVRYNIQARDSGIYYVVDSVAGCPAQTVSTRLVIDNVVADIVTQKKGACLDAEFPVYFGGIAPDTNTHYTWTFDNANVVKGGPGDTNKGPYTLIWDSVRTRVITLKVQNWRCSSFAKDTVPIFIAPPVNFDVPKDICLTDTVPVVVADYSLVSADSLMWNLDNGGTIISGGTGQSKGNLYISYNSSGTKVISLTIDYTMCTASPFNDTVMVHNPPTANIVDQSEKDICAGDTVLFTAEQHPNYKYSWAPARNLIDTEGQGGYKGRLIIPGSGNIYLIVRDQYKCLGIDSLLLNAQPCCGVYLPSAFTPNGDGRNDVFRPITIGHHKVKVFRIVNRYGQTVFESNDERRGWDGTMYGVPQDIGTYFYYINYECNGKNIEEKGDVTLIR